MLPPPCKVLDIGAGRGGLTTLLRDLGHQVEAADLHPNHFQIGGIRCHAANAQEELPFADRAFDCVVAVELIEHLENPWVFIREAMRILNDNGSLIVTSPNVVTLMSRLTFVVTGCLPYFRDSSFNGCYHATPIFPWTIERAALVAGARVVETRYSRVDWPRATDIPRRMSRYRSRLLNYVPLCSLTGEIAAYRVQHDPSLVARISTGYHTE